VVDKAPFLANGEWRLLALVKQGDSTKATFMPSVIVGHFPHRRPGFPESPATRPTSANRRRASIPRPLPTSVAT
jgi:hypothetical protein